MAASMGDPYRTTARAPRRSRPGIPGKFVVLGLGLVVLGLFTLLGSLRTLFRPATRAVEALESRAPAASAAPASAR